MKPICMFCWKLERYMKYGNWPKDIAYFLWRKRTLGEPLPQAYLDQKREARRKRREDPYAGLTDTAAYWWDVRRR